MRYILLLVIFLSINAAARPWIPSKTTNPLKDFASFFGLTPDRIVYKLEIDFNHDGRNEILLSTKLTAVEEHEEEKESNYSFDSNVRDFVVYIRIKKTNIYTQSKGMDLEDVKGLVLGAVLSIDITQCYVGYITQLKEWGLVTIQSDMRMDGSIKESYIYAYTIDVDHVKRALLVEYNPKNGENKIYNQYLSEKHRTKIHLQEVRVP